MGTIICKNCNEIIENYEDEKVSIHYSQCGTCLEDVPKRVDGGQ
ncbi:GapA-binding peptide SR1P [Peribacillus loiseleuriae]